MKPSKDTVRRILVIRTDRIGDALMMLPAIRLLRQNFPKAWITVLLDAPVASLFQSHPDIDEVASVDAKRLAHDHAYRWALLPRLKSVRYDAVIVANPQKFFHLLVFLCGIRYRAGYPRKWGFFLNRAYRGPVSGHETERNLKLVSTLTEGEWDGSIRLGENAVADRTVDALLRAEFPTGRLILAVHPGTSDPRKRWDAARFAELCLKARESGFSILMVGGPEERFLCEEIGQKIKTPYFNGAGRLTLQELASLFRHPLVRALVSSDSGPVHVAWISGLPVVSLYALGAGASDPARWGPLGNKHRSIYKPIHEITASEVHEALLSLLTPV